MFDRFHRADGSRERAGAGLVPAVGAAFVAARDGYVTVESPRGGAVPSPWSCRWLARWRCRVRRSRSHRCADRSTRRRCGRAARQSGSRAVTASRRAPSRSSARVLSNAAT
ncbi:hypothetical protein [Nocardiopsis alborubida]|uniref:hypothetical protein n=1 Tax=Nocardiopsis alborubida TaxID=146802 RepID=UPI002D80C86A|nr:hypothetical protein [Nocardiopsis alborubida]